MSVPPYYRQDDRDVFSSPLTKLPKFTSVVVLKDIDGNSRVFDSNQLGLQLAGEDTKVFGMSISCVLELRRQYLQRGGSLETTVESIQSVFGK